MLGSIACWPALERFARNVAGELGYADEAALMRYHNVEPYSRHMATRPRS
jgi:hypothetical protein